ACLLFAGCSGQKTQSQSAAGSAREAAHPREKVFNYTQTREPKHLDPAFSYDGYEGIVCGLLYDGLVNFGNGTDIQPALAEKWEISSDGKVYTFHLRDAVFSNGKRVTADDVRYSFTR